MFRRSLTAAAFALLAATSTHAQSNHCLEQRVELSGTPGLTSLHGTTVAVDGEWLAVTAPLFEERVVVYRRAGDDWSEFQTIEPEPSFAESFGASIAVSGTALAIGATDADAPSPASGVVYVYRFDGASWSLEDLATTNHLAPMKLFGASVALSGDLLAVGAPADPFGPAPFGSVEIFVRNGSNWDPTAYLTTSIDMLNDLGAAVTFANGRLFASDPMATGELPQEGEIYVYEHVAGTWEQTAAISASDGFTLWELGRCLAGDGDRIAATAPGANAVYVFEREDSDWRERRKIEAPAGSHSFGFALSLEGDRLVASDPFEDNAGALHAYVLGKQTVQEVLDLTHDAAGAQFGTSAVLHGGALYVGAPNEPLWGAAFVYPHVADAVPVTYCTPKQSSAGCLPSIASDGCPAASSTSGFHITARSLPNQKAAVLFYGVDGPAALPYQGGTLCLTPPVLRTFARSSGGNLPPINDCSGAYRFDMNRFAAGLAGGHPAPELSIPGATIHCQAWCRDPNDPFGSTLSDGLEYTVAP